MRTQLTVAASLVVDVLLSAGILAGQRGDDGETRRYSVDRDGVKAEVLRLDQKIADAVIRGDSRAGSAEAIAIPAVWGVRLTERAPDGPGWSSVTPARVAVRPVAYGIRLPEPAPS